MTDIVDRLRATQDDWPAALVELELEAADKIEQQQAEISRLTQERDEERDKRTALECVCAEAYQAVGSILADFGVFEHPDCVRLLDVLAYGQTQDGKELLPFPELPNARAEAAESRLSALQAENERLSQERAGFFKDADFYSRAAEGQRARAEAAEVALAAYLKAQRRMLDKWADGDDAVKNQLWRDLHACELAAAAALAASKGEGPAE